MHWSLCINVGDYNQVQEHLPLPPAWDQGPGPSDSKFVLAEWKNKNGFQNCYGIISVSFKNRLNWPGRRGFPQRLANVGMYDSMKDSPWDWNIYARDYSYF